MGKKKVILYLATGLNTGGAETMLYRLLEKIDRTRFQPLVVSLMDHGTLGNSIQALDIPVYSLGLNQGGLSISATWKLMQLIQRLKPDLLQGWMYHGNLAVWLVGCLSFHRIPVFWSIHHSISSLESEKSMTQRIIRWGAKISQFVQQIIFVSQTSKSQHEQLGYFSRNSCVIPNGFDTSLFQPSTNARVLIRKELGLPEETFLIGLICRYHPMKDHANFLNSAALLLQEHPDAHFVLIGRGVDWDNQELCQIIQNLSIAHRVHLLGERQDTPRLTAALDISTSSSAYGEAFPLVVGEAMACGVSCVVTDVGDSGWIVGTTGRTVSPRNPNALANAWKELIALAPDQKYELGQEARSRVIEMFSLDAIVQQYEQLYDQALSIAHK
jgi:glycosyltransferase involved in cell wall biosynthesis